MTSAAQNIPPRGNVTNGVDRILSMPRASVFRSATQLVNAATDTPVSWEVEDYDTDGMWSLASPTRLFGQTAGLYLVNGWVTWPAEGSSFRQMRIYKYDEQGVFSDAYGNVVVQPSSITITGHEIAKQIPMDRGESVELVVNHNVPAGLSLGAAGVGVRQNGFQACLISTF